MNPKQIHGLRTYLGLTQKELADALGVTNVTLSRWENGQTTPNRLAMEKLKRLRQEGVPNAAGAGAPPMNSIHLQTLTFGAEPLDFGADPTSLRVLVEGERLSYGHMTNPAFATEISEIDPLPHQRIAVYQHMLPQPRLRFLLADDAGAGKTIMAGLYIREGLTRRTLRRVLIVAPAGLVTNWRREMHELFQLKFNIATSTDARRENPFGAPESSLLIVSVDTLRGERMLTHLKHPDVVPYDLVVFDEAHKLSASRDPDGTFRATDRYRLAEAIAGVPDVPSEWRLPWSAHHLLLLTATPHMGKPFPYYCLWRLLEPEIFSTETAFELFPADARSRYFVRRVKEEMVDLLGNAIFPKRICDTQSYDLTQGHVSEQDLYDRTTEYITHYYNQARMLNRTAARFAMTVFQRRLASSTWALLCSFQNRLGKLDNLIADIECGRISEDQLVAQQRRLNDKTKDILATTSADEEEVEDGREEHEVAEDESLGGVVATSLAELEVERQKVRELVQLSEAVYGRGKESKFDKMQELLRAPPFVGEKVIIYTEHRDTLDFLVRKLEALGYAGQVAFIHGGLNAQQRDAQVEHFRKPTKDGGARFFVGTDAAAEGINLQFCWILANYDIPWNPARLEQRMGRVHRYGQKKDRVSIINLIAGKTREGKVVEALLRKMEEIRKKMGSDKVFDVIGRIFEGISLTDYVSRAVLSDSEADREALDLAGHLTEEQVRAVQVREEKIYGAGGDVRRQLPELQEALAVEELRRLLPGYVRRYLERATPIIGVDIVGDPDGEFFLRPRTRGALDSIIPALESYPESARHRLTVYKPNDKRDAVFLHPGEPVFERMSALAIERCRPAGRRGALFVDVGAKEPYLFHVGRITVLRGSDGNFPALHTNELLEQRLVGVKQFTNNQFEEAAVEHLLLLRPATKMVPAAVGLLAQANIFREAAREHLTHIVAKRLVEQRVLAFLGRLPETEEHLRRAFDYQESELAAARRRWTERRKEGDGLAVAEVERIKERQRKLGSRRDVSLSQIRREAELIRPGDVELIATAMIMPSTEPDDITARDVEVERIAVEVAMAHEAALGAVVRDVSTPPKARQAGLTDNPGFDLLSHRPNGEIRDIEVKGRVGTGELEITDNEWARAINLRERYWLYAVLDCGGPTPRLLRVQDPFKSLFAKAKGSMLISPGEVIRAAEH